MEGPANKFVLILSDDVKPADLPTRTILAFADTYLAYLAFVADEDGETFALRGVEIQEGSSKLVCTPTDIAAAKRVAESGHRTMLTNVGSAKRRAFADKVRRERRRLPASYHPKASVEKWVEPVPMEIAPESPNPWEVTTLRATLRRVGGEDPKDQWARFSSDSESGPFSASVSLEKALQLSHYLHKELDIEVRLRRNVREVIEDCKLLDFMPLEEGNSDETLREWFAPQRSEWERVDDIDAELRSMRDD